MDYPVLLYYQFLRLTEEEAKAFYDSQKALALGLGLKGRILVGTEGINGTVSGDSEAVESYKQACWSYPGLETMVFKESLSESVPFPKLKVKLRKEIISIHDNGVTVEDGAPYITPDQLQRLYENGEEFYLIDTRNSYEWQDGTFKGAVTPSIDNFRELPGVVDEYSNLKGKKVVTVCTGGIRCEKASALFRQRGFKDVYQLEGGIVSYIQKYPGQFFEGDCYVFDDRMRLTQDQIATYGKVSQAPQYPGQ